MNYKEFTGMIYRNLSLIFFSFVFFISIGLKAEGNYLKFNYGITTNKVEATAAITALGANGVITTDDSDVTDGAVYSADFNTNLGGDITVTVSGSDSHDSAEDERTATFTVDTDTPWLKLPSVSPISVGEDEDITFSIVYCVFDDTTGTPSVSVEVGAWGDSDMGAGTDNAICMNGVNYSLTSSVPWAATEQAVTFKASNDVASAANVVGSSISVNDAPIITAGSAERHFNGADFVFNATVSDANSDNGDTFKAYVTIEADTEREMTCDGAGACTLTVAETAIIDQLGGIRTVSFRAQDDTWGAESDPDTFSQVIDVTKTSSFGWVAPSDGSFLPGLNSYDFEVTNNGNSEDILTVTATSSNSWVASGSESQTVTVAKDATETFTITMDVAHVAAGIVDHWSASITAGNDDTQTNSHDGETTVASVSGVSVTIGTSSGSALPGSSVSYSFVITNTGNADEAFAYTTSSDNDWGLGGGAGTTGSLAMGASETVTVVHTVSESASSEIQIQLRLPQVVKVQLLQQLLNKHMAPL